MKYKIGDSIDIGLIPCRVCNERHVETVIKVNPLETSWALGHTYQEINPREYIQMQRDEINRLLKLLRRKMK